MSATYPPRRRVRVSRRPLLGIVWSTGRHHPGRTWSTLPDSSITSRYLMRELDRIAVVGAGRLGTALAAALRDTGRHVEGPLRRGEKPSDAATLVLLAVPDGAIAEAA